MKQHFDEGVIQAFVDGELASNLSEKVIQHVALCDECATLLAETEASNELAFSVLDKELNVLVPTERLRTKVFASIQESKNKATIWEKLARSFGFAEGFSFAKPSLVAFASLLLFVGAFAFAVKFYQSSDAGQDIVSNKNLEEIKQDNLDKGKILVKVDNKEEDNFDVKDEKPPVDIKKDAVRVKDSKKKLRPKIFKVKANKRVSSKKRKSRKTKRAVSVEEVMPVVGEDSYLQTIATLSKEVDKSKDMVLRPKERIAFEKDLAIINVAIKQTKAEIRKNPKNKAAREVLKASYKNKINLLNSVSEKGELMAGL